MEEKPVVNSGFGGKTTEAAIFNNKFKVIELGGFLFYFILKLAAAET